MSSWEIKTNSENCQYTGYPYLAGDGYRCNHPENDGKECKDTLCPIAILTSAMHSDGEGRCTCEVVHGHRMPYKNCSIHGINRRR